MKVKLFLLLSLLIALPAIALAERFTGVVKDANGKPLVGAVVVVRGTTSGVSTDIDGKFAIEAEPNKTLVISMVGYDAQEVAAGKNIKVTMKAIEDADYFSDEDFVINEAELEDEEGASQSVSTLAGASDNVYYNAASYDFSLMRFRLRGYDSEYSDTYINGVNFNDATRGRFNYSMIGGMNTAFKRKEVNIGLEANSFSLGQIGGSTDISVFAQDYAPGFNGSVAYTNSNYKLRAMTTYSTGLMKNGWAVTLSAITRYADEGVVPGSFYNSWGYFLSAQKVFNKQHSLSFVTFGAPTKRTNSSALQCQS